MKNTLLVLATLTLGLPSLRASIVITEVMSSEGAGQTYAADWFELTNTGPSSVSIAGWKMDDNSNLFANAVSLTGVTSIAAGQSVVFVEGSATTQTAFVNSWFGGTAPAGFSIGSYSGSSVSLSSTTDAVNIYDSGGTLQANVVFQAATTGVSFDNAAGLNNATISATSVVGTNGAFAAPGPSTEIGSPGAVPEPSSALLLAGGAAVLGFRRRRAA